MARKRKLPPRNAKTGRFESAAKRSRPKRPRARTRSRRNPGTRKAAVSSMPDWMTNPPKRKSVRAPDPAAIRRMELALAGSTSSQEVKALAVIMKNRARGATHNPKRSADLQRLAKILDWAARKAADLGL